MTQGDKLDQIWLYMQIIHICFIYIVTYPIPNYVQGKCWPLKPTYLTKKKVNKQTICLPAVEIFRYFHRAKASILAPQYYTQYSLVILCKDRVRNIAATPTNWYFTAWISRIPFIKKRQEAAGFTLLTVYCTVSFTRLHLLIFNVRPIRAVNQKRKHILFIWALNLLTSCTQNNSID